MENNLRQLSNTYYVRKCRQNMAFFRGNDRRGHTYYNVVETIQTEDGPRQDQLLYIGRIDKLEPADRRSIQSELADIDPSLLPDFFELLVEHGHDFSGDDPSYPLDAITPTSAVDYGPVAALHAVAEHLGVREVLDRHCDPKGGGPPLSKLLLVHSIARCVEPFSCEGIARWYPTTALPGLLELPAAPVTGETLRNSLTYLPEDAIDTIHEALWDRVQDRYDTPTEPLFYDLTTSYFEGTACPLAEYGYSSDKRPDKRQLTFGVTVNPDMVPLQHDVYPGDKKQSDTVTDAATSMLDRDLPGSVILVMDKGCTTKAVRADLRSGDITEFGVPIEYVIVRKNQGEAVRRLEEIDRQRFQPVALPEGASPMAVTEIEPPAELADAGCRWIASFNSEKADRDAASRAENLEAAEAGLETAADRQYGARPRSKNELIQKAETVLKTHSVGDLIAIDVNDRGPPRLSWRIDEEAVAEAATLDGKAMFETTCSREQLSPSAVACAYRDRDVVEKFMESFKDLANVRPLYVWTEQRVRARVFLCVLSVLLLAVLQLELDNAGKEMTGMRALEILRGVHRVEFSAGGDEAMVVKTTELSDKQEELAHIFDLTI